VQEVVTFHPPLELQLKVMKSSSSSEIWVQSIIIIIRMFAFWASTGFIETI
jgi:hypothetical protein